MSNRTPRPLSPQEKKDAAKERRQALLGHTDRLLEDIDFVLNAQLDERLAQYAEADVAAILASDVRQTDTP